MAELPKLPENSVHLVVTDPPYFLAGMDARWTHEEKAGTRPNRRDGRLKCQPFDTDQGSRLQSFMHEVGNALLPILCPGAFGLFFSQPRMSHRMACGLEDAGFDLRDHFAWNFRSAAMFKAFSMDHFVDALDLDASERLEIKRRLSGRKTPQLRALFESIIMVQKPKEGTHVENWLAYETGLIDSTASMDGNAPSTVMRCEKESRDEWNNHLTVKPVRLLAHLIEVFSVSGQTVLDPFLGSGSTAVAAERTGRRCIGIEIDPAHVEIAERRLAQAESTPLLL